VTEHIHTRLALARTRLVLDHPFIGALVMHLPLVAAESRDCPTVATNARALYFNPDYIATLGLLETQFVLAHEAMHCALGHFARRSHRIRHRWDIACDHAVNLILIQEGMRPPPGVLADTAYLGLSAEEIYPLIPIGTVERPLDRHLFDASSRLLDIAEKRAKRADGQRAVSTPFENGSHSCDDVGDMACAGTHKMPSTTAPDVNDAGRADTLAERWQSRLATAALAAQQAGRLSDSIARSLGRYLAPRQPWRTLLARYLTGLARDDFTFRRASRRDGEALLPGLGSESINVIVALDTSGSIGEDEMREFVSEVDALKGQLRAHLVLHACDTELDAGGPWRFAPWEPLRLPAALKGGGGTRFTPVFEWIERERLHPDVLLYFTDAQGAFPPAAPPYPVVWLVKGCGGVPWGERIQLN
jgi:predicted metal-dependent peptidase